jgi:hypothetical protein
VVKYFYLFNNKRVSAVPQRVAVVLSGYREPPPPTTEPPETRAYTVRSPAGLQIETQPLTGGG